MHAQLHVLMWGEIQLAIITVAHTNMLMRNYSVGDLEKFTHPCILYLPPNSFPAAPPICSVAGVYTRHEEAAREGTELWDAHHPLPATQNTKQEVKAKDELDDSGEKKGNESADTSSEVCAEHCSAVLEWKTEGQC